MRGSLAALAALVLLTATRPATAQRRIEELTAEPEQAAELFLRSVRAIRWSAAAQFMHADALARFHQTVSMIAEADTTGDMRAYLTGTDAAAYGALSPADVFGRSVGAVIDDMPGLMHALFDRDDEVLGAVREGAASAHVVYRTTARISGAVPEVKVLQLGRSERGWRVTWSDELEVLDTALRGAARTRRAPGS